MTNSWDEFLERAKRHAASEEPMALQAVWSEFLQQSQASPRAEALQSLAKAVQKAPMDQRASVAIVMASLLAPLEWPQEWEQYRARLGEALAAIVSTLVPEEPGALRTLLGPAMDRDVLASGGGLVLSCATRLLLTCRRDELRTIATLCDVGLNQVILVFREELAKRAGQPLEGALLQARMRFDAAVDRYAQVARALNSAAGEVLFKYLDRRLEGPET